MTARFACMTSLRSHDAGAFVHPSLMSRSGGVIRH
jgi:hypothetical protein